MNKFYLMGASNHCSENYYIIGYFNYNNDMQAAIDYAKYRVDKKIERYVVVDEEDNVYFDSLNPDKGEGKIIGKLDRFGARDFNVKFH